MRCEEVRPLLAEMAEAGAGMTPEVASHLGACASCSAELGRYRATLMGLSSLRDDVLEPPARVLERALAGVPVWRRRLLTRRVWADERIRYTALSLGGVVVGAVAMGMLRRRAAARRAAVAGASTAA
jgi:hypothetical protein